MIEDVIMQKQDLNSNSQARKAKWNLWMLLHRIKLCNKNSCLKYHSLIKTQIISFDQMLVRNKERKEDYQDLYLEDGLLETQTNSKWE